MAHPNSWFGPIPTDDSLSEGELAEGDARWLTPAQAAATYLATSKVRTARSADTAVAGLAVSTITVTFATAFADTNYTPVVSVLRTSGTGTPVSRRLQNKTASSIEVVIENTGATSANVVVNVVAIHD